MVGPLLPLLCGINCFSGVDHVWFLEKFHEHAVELGQALLALIYEILWESTYGSMKYGPLWFTVVTYKDRTFYHHLDVVPFPFNFVLSSVLGPFMRDDEDLGRSGEVVDLFEIKIMNLTRAILQVQYDGTYPLGIN